MAWGERADAVLEVVVESGVPARSWIWGILNVLSGSAADAPESDVQVRVRATGQVIYSLQLTAGLATDEGVRGFEEELRTLSLEEFCKNYNIPVPR